MNNTTYKTVVRKIYEPKARVEEFLLDIFIAISLILGIAVVKVFLKKKRRRR